LAVAMVNLAILLKKGNIGIVSKQENSTFTI